MEEIINQFLTALFVVLAAFSIIIYTLFHFLIKKPKISKQEKVDRERFIKDHYEKEALKRLSQDVWSKFAVRYDSINYPEFQDEIVRTVNQLGTIVAIAVVNHDKQINGVEIKEIYEWRKHDGSEWTSHCIHRYKTSWVNSRNLCLRILPQLKDRVPHFSQLEPLKSYLAKHSNVDAGVADQTE